MQREFTVTVIVLKCTSNISLSILVQYIFIFPKWLNLIKNNTKHYNKQRKMFCKSLTKIQIGITCYGTTERKTIDRELDRFIISRYSTLAVVDKYMLRQSLCVNPVSQLSISLATFLFEVKKFKVYYPNHFAWNFAQPC